MTTANLAQKLAGVWPRSHLVFQPSVGLGKLTYTRIEMQVWIGDKHYAQARIVPDEMMALHGPEIVEQMIADMSRAIYAKS